MLAIIIKNLSPLPITWEIKGCGSDPFFVDIIAYKKCSRLGVKRRKAVMDDKRMGMAGKTVERLAACLSLIYREG